MKHPYYPFFIYNQCLFKSLTGTCYDFHWHHWIWVTPSLLTWRTSTAFEPHLHRQLLQATIWGTIWSSIREISPFRYSKNHSKISFFLMVFSRCHLQHKRAFNHRITTKHVSDLDLVWLRGWPDKIQYKH